MQLDLLKGIHIKCSCGCKDFFKGKVVLHPVGIGRAELTLLDPHVLFNIFNEHRPERREPCYELPASKILVDAYTSDRECSKCVNRKRRLEETHEYELKRQRADCDREAESREKTRLFQLAQAREITILAKERVYETIHQASPENDLNQALKHTNPDIWPCVCGGINREYCKKYHIV